MSKTRPPVAIIGDEIAPPPSPKVYALFVDMMGFAWAIGALTDDEHTSLRNRLTNPDVFYSSTPRVDTLAHRYWRLHNAITHVYRPSSIASSYISFSDSVVLVVEDWTTAERYALDLMKRLFDDGVPVRIGIGYGTFERLRFSMSTDPAGALSAEAPFYGTSIVFAHRANEAQSCKGFRILLHPSVAATVARPHHIVVPLEADEASSDCSHELNFLFNHRTGGYFHARPFKARVTGMREGVTEPRPLKHYDRMSDLLKHFESVCVAAVPGALTGKKTRVT